MQAWIHVIYSEIPLIHKVDNIYILFPRDKPVSQHSAVRQVIKQSEPHEAQKILWIIPLKDPK